MEAKLICFSFLIVLVATLSGCDDSSSSGIGSSSEPASSSGGCANVSASARKILCLHGGGEGAAGFQAQAGMAALEEALCPDYEFVYAQAPDGGLWMRDPPGGKGQATTDPDWSSESISILDQIVQDQGPFYGILGYSQGSAFVPAYLSYSTVNTFQVAMMFCGYLPTTHSGIMERINAATPWNDISAFVFMGEQDSVITNAMTEEQAGVFTSPVIVRSSSAGHLVPTSPDSTFQEAVNFLRNA